MKKGKERGGSLILYSSFHQAAIHLQQCKHQTSHHLWQLLMRLFSFQSIHNPARESFHEQDQHNTAGLPFLHRHDNTVALIAGKLTRFQQLAISCSNVVSKQQEHASLLLQPKPTLLFVRIEKGSISSDLRPSLEVSWTSSLSWAHNTRRKENISFVSSLCMTLGPGGKLKNWKENERAKREEREGNLAGSMKEEEEFQEADWALAVSKKAEDPLEIFQIALQLHYLQSYLLERS